MAPVRCSSISIVKLKDLLRTKSNRLIYISLGSHKIIKMSEFFPRMIHIQKTSKAYSKEFLGRRMSSACPLERLLDMHAAWVSNILIIIQRLQKLANISDSSME